MNLPLSRSWYSTVFITIALFSRKKKKDKEKKKRLEEQILTNQYDEGGETQKGYVDKRTPAQMAFDKTQEKRVSGRFSICWVYD